MEPFLGEIRMMSFPFVPRGWAVCNGQMMSIAQNTALFALLGTKYGGDGRTTFALPNLQGRVPIHPDILSPGESGGEARHALSEAEMPAHSHAASANASQADEVSPVGHFWGGGGQNLYAAASDGTTASPQAIAGAGAGAPHDNMSPYLVLNLCIAVQGTFPARN